MAMTTTTRTTPPKPITTDVLGPRDVLLGRGTGPNEHIGNIEFRALIREAIEKAGKKGLEAKRKTGLARKVIAKVKAGGGRFVRKIKLQEGTAGKEDGDDDQKEDLLGNGGGRYEEVCDELALDKTKQSFRHQLRVLVTPNQDNQRAKIVLPVSVSPPSSPQPTSTAAYLVDGILRLKAMQEPFQPVHDTMSPMSISLLSSPSTSRASVLQSIAAQDMITKAFLADSHIREQILYPAPRSLFSSRPDSGLLGPLSIFGDLGISSYSEHEERQAVNNSAFLDAILLCRHFGRQPQYQQQHIRCDPHPRYF